MFWRVFFRIFGAILSGFLLRNSGKCVPLFERHCGKLKKVMLYESNPSIPGILDLGLLAAYFGADSLCRIFGANRLNARSADGNHAVVSLEGIGVLIAD